MDHERLPSLDEPTYPLAIAADAADVNHLTFRMYANARRAPLVGTMPVREGDDVVAHPYVLGRQGSHRGMPTLLSLRGVLTYAVATALMDWGVSASIGQEIALRWTLLDGRVEKHQGSVVPPRRACELFGEGRSTILVVGSEVEIVPAVLRDGRLELGCPWIGRSGRASLVLELDGVHERCLRVCRTYVEDQASRG